MLLVDDDISLYLKTTCFHCTAFTQPFKVCNLSINMKKKKKKKKKKKPNIWLHLVWIFFLQFQRNTYQFAIDVLQGLSEKRSLHQVLTQKIKR